jgi:hypothetical protein
MRCLRSNSIIVLDAANSYDKKHQFKVAFLLLFMVSFFPRPAQAKYGGGDGTAENPYLIYTAEQMNTIGTEPNDWDKHFKLMADIDLSIYTGDEFNIIGNYTTHFTGGFDGNGHNILNLTYCSTEEDKVGLFGYVYGGGFENRTIIKDLGLIDPNIDAGTGDYVGALVGYFFEGTITGCYVQDGSLSGGNCVGGLVGGTPDVPVNDFPRRDIRNCFTTTTNVSGTENVGGLIGFYNGYMPFRLQERYKIREYYEITGCYAISDVLGTEKVGGLIGHVIYGSISNCYSRGSASGNSFVGGLIGINQGMIKNCYSTSHVEGQLNTGGLIGSFTSIPFDLYDGQVNESFWDIETSGQATSAGGISKTTAEMKKKATFENWDFTEVWDIAENQTYSFLRYSVAGDLDHDGKVDFADFKIMALHWLEER